MTVTDTRTPLITPRVIETDFMTTTFISDSIVMVRGKPEVNVNRDIATRANKLIEDSMPGNYGMIIDREADYSIMPVEVFQIPNNIKTLKAIAIVVHRELSVQTTAIDKLLFNGDLGVFSSVNEAKKRLDKTLQRQQNPLA